MKSLKEDTALERLYNGLVKENPTFVLLLGMCPTLAITTSAINGIGMGLTTTLVLFFSNMFISMLRKIIPDKVRIPAFIVIVASFVTIVQFLLEAYLPSLNDSLGLYIPLIVVNCIILGRAEAYAYKHKVVASAFDGLGMGLGFTMAITILGAIRELLGAGTVFGYRIIPEAYNITILVLAPGAFLVLAFLVAIMNKVKISRGNKPISADCASCGLCGQEACGQCPGAALPEEKAQGSAEAKTEGIKAAGVKAAESGAAAAREGAEA